MLGLYSDTSKFGLTFLRQQTDSVRQVQLDRELSLLVGNLLVPPSKPAGTDILFRFWGARLGRRIGQWFISFFPYFVGHVTVIGWLSKGRIMPILTDVSQLLVMREIILSALIGLVKPRDLDLPGKDGLGLLLTLAQNPAPNDCRVR